MRLIESGWNQENPSIETRRKLMKPNQSSNVKALTWAGNSFLRKLFVSSLMIALLFASLPARTALAAPASGGTTANASEMQKDWGNKIQKVDYNSTFYQRVRVYPADFEDQTELATANDILNKYGVALLAAQRIVFNHSGFDQKGKVVNENLANQSLKDLGENLRLMRVYKDRLNGLEGSYRLLPMSAVTTATAQ
jgi:hypothetical protein